MVITDGEYEALVKFDQLHLKLIISKKARSIFQFEILSSFLDIVNLECGVEIIDIQVKETKKKSSEQSSFDDPAAVQAGQEEKISDESTNRSDLI